MLTKVARLLTTAGVSLKEHAMGIEDSLDKIDAHHDQQQFIRANKSETPLCQLEVFQEYESDIQIGLVT